MNVKFGDILAGRAGRSRKPQHHRIVDRLLIRVAQQRPRRHPRRRNFAGQAQLSTAPACGPGNPHDRDRARRPARRKGKDGLFPRMHRLFVPEPVEKATQLPAPTTKGCARACRRCAANAAACRIIAASPTRIQASIRRYTQDTSDAYVIAVPERNLSCCSYCCSIGAQHELEQRKGRPHLRKDAPFPNRPDRLRYSSTRRIPSCSWCCAACRAGSRSRPWCPSD